MNRLALVRSILIMAALVLTLSGGVASAEEFSATFSGFQEIGGLGAGETGAILSNGNGTLHLDLDKHSSTMAYTLTYSDLSAPVTQAHIHFGRRHVAGGISVFLCSNLPNPPAGTPACPAGGGTVTGTITGASVIGPTAQGVTPGDFAAVEAMLEAHAAYGNIHTTNFPAGEIRGQIRQGNGPGPDDHK
jgi:CHRD domain